MARNLVTDDERARMIQLRRQKMSYNDIAFRMNRSAETVRAVVKGRRKTGGRIHLKDDDMRFTQCGQKRTSRCSNDLEDVDCLNCIRQYELELKRLEEDPARQEARKLFKSHKNRIAIRNYHLDNPGKQNPRHR